MDAQAWVGVLVGVMFVFIGGALHKGAPPGVEKRRVTRFFYHLIALGMVAVGLLILAIVTLQALGVVSR